MTVYYRFKYHGCKIFIVDGEIYKKISKKTRVSKFDALASTAYTELVKYAMKYKLDNCILVNRLYSDKRAIMVEPLPKHDKPKYTTKMAGVNLWNVTGNILNVISATKSNINYKDVSKIVTYSRQSGKQFYDINPAIKEPFNLNIDEFPISDYNPYSEHIDMDDHVNLAKTLMDDDADIDMDVPSWYGYNNHKIFNKFRENWVGVADDKILNYLLASLIIIKHNESKLRYGRKRTQKR